MYTQVEKTKEHKNRTHINSVIQKKSNVKQGFGFVYTRQENIVQKGVQENQVNQLQSPNTPTLQFCGHKKHRPKYIDPVKKPEIRYSGIPTPRTAVRLKLGVPKEHLNDTVVAIPRESIAKKSNDVKKALGLLPDTYKKNPDVERLLREQDSEHTAATHAIRKSKQNKTDIVTDGRVREVLAAVEYANQKGLPTSLIKSATGYDFDIGKEHIDPFELPIQGGFQKFILGDGKEGAYPKHTSGTKGGGKNVVGVLDTTYSSPDEVASMDQYRKDNGIAKGHRFDVRVPLEDEYINDYIKYNPKLISLLNHRGSDPTKKWGPYDPDKQARNKARYDREKLAREAKKKLNTN